jgi:tetratricopeptide (TPR) repeat protein
MKPAWSDRARTHVLAVTLLAIAVYANSLLNGFALDDNFIVLTNPRVHDIGNLRDIWLTPYWTFAGAELGLYRPGIIFLYAVQWAIAGGAAWFFHAVNVALHAGASVLVLLLLRRLTGPTPALVGALIFAVHPVHTEAVANIVGQAELVAALCVLAACLIHCARAEGVAVSWWRRIAIALLFAAAITTKESAVVLPALLVIVDFAQRRVRLTVRGLAAYADAMLMPVFLLTAVLAFYLVVRFEVMGGTLIGVDAAPSMPFLREQYRVLNALRAFPEFLRLLLFPLDLAADYSPAALLPVDTVRPMVVLGSLLLAGLTLLALLTPWLPAAGFPAAWFLISILTVSNLFFPIGVVIAERTLYLPSVAVSALVAFAWQAAAPRASLSARRLTLVLVPVVVVLMGVRTWVRNPVWDSTDTVWESMMRDQPLSYRTHWLHAMQLWGRREMREAEAAFRFAYRLYPRDGQMITEYANFLMSQGRFEEALPLLEDAHAMHPWIVRTTVTLMHAYLAVGRYPDAIRTAELARRTGGTPGTAFPVQAYASQQSGDFDAAIAAWRLALRYSDPQPWPLHGLLARARASAGYHEAALAGLDSARTAVTDTTGIAVLASVEQGVRSGCYRRAGLALQESGTPLPPRHPLGVECDRLGQWFNYLLVRQSANDSQNAMTPGLPAPVSTPAGVP